VASQEGAAIRARAPYVDLVFGPQTLHRLPEMIDAGGASKARAAGGRRQLSRDREVRPPARAARRRPVRFVSVMEGCSKYCTFCVVPYTRGEEVSRPVADVMREVAQLAAQGVREINLLGQNVNAYRGPSTAIRRPRRADPLRGRGRRHRAGSASPPRIRWSSPTA
jgi:tRNA-2-methylthio-N6-dimethylallyladenosine synthase